MMGSAPRTFSISNSDLLAFERLEKCHVGPIGGAARDKGA